MASVGTLLVCLAFSDLRNDREAVCYALEELRSGQIFRFHPRCSAISLVGKYFIPQCGVRSEYGYGQ